MARFELPADSESKFIGDLKEGTGYGFDIRAIAQCGSSGTASTSVTTKLSVPTNLIADPIHPTEMNLTWEDHSNNERLYRVTYSPPPPPPPPPPATPPDLEYEYVAIAPANATGMPLIGLEPNTPYDLSVRAAMSLAYGAWSDPALGEATTPPAGGSPEPVPLPHPSQTPPQGSTVYSWTIAGDPKYNTNFVNTGHLTFGGQYSTPWSLTRLPLGAALGQVTGTITSVAGSDVRQFTYPGTAFRVAKLEPWWGLGVGGVTIWLEDQTGRTPNDYDYDDGYWHVTLTSMTIGTVPPPLPPAPPPPQPPQDGLPWVWITTTDVVGSEIPDPGESTPASIEFTVWRSAPTTGSLTVHLFPAAGTATANDYTGMPGSVTIPAGSDHKSFTVTPVADLLIEGFETVSVLLKSHSSYHLRYGYEATAVIRDNTPDLDVDSDNDNGFNNPVRNQFEDDIEDDLDKPGKVIAVNDDDSDADGIADYADGFDLFPDTTLDDFNNGEQFVPLYLALPAGLSAQTTLKLVYDDSPPLAVTRSETEPYVYTPGPGTLRVWKNTSRTGATIGDGGAWWQDGGVYTLSQLGFSVAGVPTTQIFKLEAIRPTAGTVADRIELWIDPDGNAGPAGMIFADAVRVTSYPGLIRIDADRDGTIRFSPSDSSQSDRTASNRPYRFWTNNDSDLSTKNGGEDIVPGDAGYVPDFLHNEIKNNRDIEDWARLTIRPPPGYDANDQTWGVRLKLVDNETDGGAAIRYFFAGEYVADNYLRDPQIQFIEMPISAPLMVGNWDTLPDFPFWVSQFGQVDLLFEGAVNGDCKLVVEAWHGSNKVAEDSFDLKLMSIREMYEGWTVPNPPGASPQAPGGHTNVWGDPKTDDWAVAPTAERMEELGEYTTDSPETNDVIVFVHGWRMQPDERLSYAETAYKRLYWQGFKGRFILYSWPTQWVHLDGNWFSEKWHAVRDPGNYARSQEIAYHSARALAHRLKVLHQTYGGAQAGTVSMFSHSMGGVVASEALRILTTEQTGQIVHTYVASQNAVSADAYLGGSTIPYPQEFNGYLGGTNPYFRSINQAAQKVVNFYNEDDHALNKWDRNNNFKPNFNNPGTFLSLVPGFDAKYAFYYNVDTGDRVCDLLPKS